MSEIGFPKKDGAARDYMVNVANTVAQNMGSYMLSQAACDSLTQAAMNYSAAYTLATDPPTRTKLTIIQKDEQRAAAEAMFRLYLIQIKYNAGITTDDKAAIGVSQPNNARTPRHVPATLPLLSIVGSLQGSHTLQYLDPETGAKARPFGAQMLELRLAIADEAGGTPEDARPYGVFSRNPIGVAFAPADNKKVATYWGRWANTRGQVGPWSLPTSMTIAA